MNPARALVVVAIVVLGPSFALAGDLDDLPKDDAGFREKIAAFIKPGGSAIDARSLLELHRFRCQKTKDAEGPFIWCDRSDGTSLSSVKQRYQVVLRTGDARAVTAVKTSTGLVGP